jgi:hypothetical protein
MLGGSLGRQGYTVSRTGSKTMPRFLLWNLNNKPVPHLVKEAARSNDVDVLVLAECEIPIGVMLTTLNAETPDFQFAPGQCERIQVSLASTLGFSLPSSKAIGIL